MRFAILAFLILAGALPASAADPVAVIRITATYPGTDARTIDETVLSPLYRQINGVEGITRIESEARNDGTGILTVHFAPKTDPNLAEVQIHNRVNLALPTIPEPCRKLGISVRKLPAGPPTFWLALTSVDPNHDEKDLKNFALIYLKPEFARIPGVADVRVVGVGEPGVRVWVKPDRLRAYNQTAGDVVEALRRQNRGTAAGAIGGPALQHTVTASGRLTKVEQFADVILRANPNGEVLRVKDVARVELGTATGGFTHVNGRPAALIAVTAWPGRVTAERFYKSEGVGELPPGISFEVVTDRAADHLVAVEVRLPNSASLDRTEKVIKRAADLIRGLPGKPGTVAVVEGREPNAATIFVKVRAKGGPTAADVDKALAGMSGAAIRVGDVPPGEEAFPVRIALTDPGELTSPGERGDERFREVPERVLARLVKDKNVAEPAAFPVLSAPQRVADIDRDKCAQRGVELNDVFTTLQASLGGVHATDFHKFGRMFRVTVQTEPQFAQHIDDLGELSVRNAQGEMVFLSALVKIQKSSGPTAVVRVNGYRAIIITAAPAAGETPAAAAARCVKLAREVLPRGYRVHDTSPGAQPRPSIHP
jgi:multidrug efflux pump subunit AcrB